LYFYTGITASFPMQKKIILSLPPAQAASELQLKEAIGAAIAVSPGSITGYTITRRSIDARSRQAKLRLECTVYINEPVAERTVIPFLFQDVSKATNTVIIAGAGPTGLFAALRLIELGIKPVILERGKDVRSRRRDLALLNREGILNPESNYCFGEGGAGTYSDGKLYTRSTKRGNITRILQMLVHFGAGEEILYDAHPHIGTNKLPAIITAMRQQITNSGGDFLFEKKLVDFTITNNRFTRALTADGNFFEGTALVLATGHSARDVFELLHRKNLLIEPKPFALGVRVEHPQLLIDSIQYHCAVRDTNLPPASYSLVQQVNERGIFSFCMCPGGIIAPASTAHGELVVNGWSPSKRNNPFANSGIVAEVKDTDIARAGKYLPHFNYNPDILSPLDYMHFQHAVEQKAFAAGGGKFVAPAQRMTDFTNNITSGSLPACSYLPGVNSVNLNEVLPPFVVAGLRNALKQFGKKMNGYFTNEAIIVATESRTSSPVRIPRHKELLHHPQVQNMYPCGEGAGYAGGIVSAAMDGERVAEAVAQVCTRF
jgi:uncharacterized protein